LFYTGGLHKYYYTESATSTKDNWTLVTPPDNNLYIYLTGANHLIGVNGTYYIATWNASTSTFSLSTTPTVTINTGDDLATELSGLSGIQLIAIAGTPVTGTATIALPNQQVIVRGSSFAGNLFEVNSGESLTITSGVIADTVPNVSVNVNGGTFTVTPTSGHPLQIGGVTYLANGNYITLGSAIASIIGVITIEVPSPTNNLQIANRVTGYSITDADAVKVKYINQSAWNVVRYFATQLRLQAA
jgi:hypothetical protein